jgi:hypothetical protein
LKNFILSVVWAGLSVGVGRWKAAVERLWLTECRRGSLGWLGFDLFELLGCQLSLIYQTGSIFAALERDFEHCQELSVSTAMQDGCREPKAERALGLLFATGRLRGWTHDHVGCILLLSV